MEPSPDSRTGTYSWAIATCSHGSFPLRPWLKDTGSRGASSRSPASPDSRLLSVVILTTSDEDRDRIEFDHFGVAGDIVKPVTLLSFVETMANPNNSWMLSESL